LSLYTRAKAVCSDALRRFRGIGILPMILDHGQDARATICPFGRLRAGSYGHTTNRWLVRGMCLALAAVALSPVVPGTFASAAIPALSPFVAVAAVVATRTLPALAWLGLAVGAIALWRHRFFCRWVCPVGPCMDGASRLGQRLGRRTTRFPLLGHWIVGLTLGGACFGYPFLLWLDPLARFAGLFVLGDRGPRLGMSLSIAAFLALLLLDVLRPHTWCTRLCPLGAFQDLSASLCGSLRSLRQRKCGDPGAANKRLPLPRRMLFSIAAGIAGGGAARWYHQGASRPLRPPGATEELTFRGVCTRCGNCVRACPAGIIERDLGQNGWASLLTPTLRFRHDYCREDCVRCTEACPSRALARLSLQEKASVRLGLPRVDMKVCLLADDRECSVCRSRCPYDAIRYVFSEADYTLTPQIDREKCTGCGACEAACPTAPNKAIVVLPT
jgi:ferredoxin-type protein NapF